MKKSILFLALLQSLLIVAQAPQKMSYQSVVRNAANQIVANQSIGVKISIIEGSLTGTTAYAERHTTTTNANGLFTIEAGGGTPTIGTFAIISPVVKHLSSIPLEIQAQREKEYNCYAIFLINSRKIQHQV